MYAIDLHYTQTKKRNKHTSHKQVALSKSHAKCIARVLHSYIYYDFSIACVTYCICTVYTVQPCICHATKIRLHKHHQQWRTVFKIFSLANRLPFRWMISSKLHPPTLICFQCNVLGTLNKPNNKACWFRNSFHTNSLQNLNKDT